ncbi:effector-associated domain 2-containing protein [Micromonospora chalcea]|uniref:effector-associated domain 2-containing protein n=1 Tax=Micromonospora chalcea TaxID=1874 RepID=UPI00157C42FB|nr:alpha/beta hydrolase [Micromonospora chalcea]
MVTTTVVFVHGFLSSDRVWSAFRELIRDDPALGDVETHAFRYATSLLSWHPLRQVPTFDEVADSLRTFLRHDLAHRPRLALVTHSQGGLVAQRTLARMLADDDPDLARIRLLLMYACPTAGSDLGLSTRRALLRANPQEQQLRPLNAAVLDAQRAVLHRLVHVPDPSMRVLAFAGESDAVVSPASARSLFPDTGVLPGDHFGIVRPDSPQHRSYVVLRQALLHLAVEDDRSRANTVPQPRTPTAAPPPANDGELVDLLLKVPGMADPAFREQAYARLPPRVREQLSRPGPVRLELLAALDTLRDYRHLAAGRAFADALAALVPEHPVVDELRERLVALDAA